MQSCFCCSATFKSRDLSCSIVEIPEFTHLRQIYSPSPGSKNVTASSASGGISFIHSPVLVGILSSLSLSECYSGCRNHCKFIGAEPSCVSQTLGYLKSSITSGFESFHPSSSFGVGVYFVHNI